MNRIHTDFTREINSLERTRTRIRQARDVFSAEEIVALLADIRKIIETLQLADEKRALRLVAAVRVPYVRKRAV